MFISWFIEGFIWLVVLPAIPLLLAYDAYSRWKFKREVKRLSKMGSSDVGVSACDEGIKRCDALMKKYGWDKKQRR